MKITCNSITFSDKDVVEVDDLGEDSETATYLGNACEAFDIDTISAIELPNPRFSFAALLAADQQLPLEQDADDVHENP